MKTVCFTGHRPDKLGGYDERNPLAEFVKDELRRIVRSLITEGARKFICGGALGVDTWAAEIVLSLREEFPDIYLLIAKPFPSQAVRWNTDAITRFEFICSCANEVMNVNPDPYAVWKMQARNGWMVDHSDVVVCVWDGSKGGTANCHNYAQGKKQLVIINPRNYADNS